MTHAFMKRRHRIAILSISTVAVLAIAITAFILRNPLVFSESFAGHQHCMKAATLELIAHAIDNGGRLPSHTNGYADAVMSINSTFPAAFTGPGYSIAPVQAAWKEKKDIPESELGRVYVQGLIAADNPAIAVLFDKLPTPGGDHGSWFARFNAPLVREVGLLDGSMERILEKDWPEFSRKQIELLTTAGMSRQVAETYYAEQPKPELAAMVTKYSKR